MGLCGEITADYLSELYFPLFGAIWQHYLDCINKQTVLGPSSIGEGAESDVFSKGPRDFSK